MQVTETRSEGLSREFKIVIPASDLESRLMQQLEQMKGQIRLKGFRPGKVPVSYLRKAYGKSLMGDVIQETVNEVSTKALEERNLRPVQAPKIDFEGELDPVVEGKEDLTISLAVEVMPEFEPADVSKITLERPVADVTAEDVEEALENLAEQQKTFKPRGAGAKARDGDRVIIDFVGRIDGEEFEGGTAEALPLILGSDAFIPGFEEQLVGVKTGDKVTVKVTFPEDYSAHQFAGKEAEFEVTIKEVAEPQAAKVDDDLAKQLGLESLAQLRELVEGRIKADYARASREKLKRRLLDVMDELHDFDLPAGLVESEFEQIWEQVKADLERSGKSFEDEGETEESAREEYRKIAERRVRLGLVLAELGRLNKIDVTQEELSQALSERARQFPGQEQQVFDFYSKNPQALSQIRAPLFEEKMIDFILELAEVTDKKVSREELLADPDADEAETAPAPKKAAKKKGAKKKAAPKKKSAAKKKTVAEPAAKAEK